MGQTCAKKKKKIQKTVKTSTDTLIISQLDSADQTDREQTSKENFQISERKELRILSPNAGQLAGILSLLEPKSIEARKPPLQVFVGTGTVPLGELAEKLQPQQFKETESGKQPFKSNSSPTIEFKNVEETETEIISLNLNNRKIDYSKCKTKESISMITPKFSTCNQKIECHSHGYNKTTPIPTKLSPKALIKPQKIPPETTIQKQECNKCGFTEEVPKTNLIVDTLAPLDTDYHENEGQKYMLKPQPNEISNITLYNTKELQNDPTQGCRCNEEEGWKSVCKCERPETNKQSVSCNCALTSNKPLKKTTHQTPIQNVPDPGEPSKLSDIKKITCICADSCKAAKEFDKMKKIVCKCAESPQTCLQTVNRQEVLGECDASSDIREQSNPLPKLPDVPLTDSKVTLEQSEEESTHARELVQVSSDKLIQPTASEKTQPSPDLLMQGISDSLPVAPAKPPSPKPIPPQDVLTQLPCDVPPRKRKETEKVLPVPPVKKLSPKPRPPLDLITQLPCDMSCRKRLKEPLELLPVSLEKPPSRKPNPAPDLLTQASSDMLPVPSAKLLSSKPSRLPSLITQLSCDMSLRKRLKESSELPPAPPENLPPSKPKPSYDLMTPLPCDMPVEKRLEKSSESVQVAPIKARPLPNRMTQLPCDMPPKKRLKESAEMLPVLPVKQSLPKPRSPLNLMTQLTCDIPCRKRLKQSSEALPLQFPRNMPLRKRLKESAEMLLVPPVKQSSSKPKTPPDLMTQLPCDMARRKRLRPSLESLLVAPPKPPCSQLGPSSDLMTLLPCTRPLRKRFQEYSEEELVTEITVDEIFNESVQVPSRYNLEDPSAKIVNLLEIKYNKKFNTISELMQKPPKDVILFMTSGVLPQSTQISESADCQLDYEDFLNSMRSGV